MKTRTLFHRFLSIVTLLTLLLPLSPAPSLLARQVPLPSHTEGLVDATADTCSPSAVANLVASTGASPGTVELGWVAPGDDATAGTASAYIVRHNSTTITESNWDTSTNVTGEPTPSPAGSVESMTVSGLTPGRTYYFAIKTQDEVSNTSGVSNSPRATAQKSPNTAYLPLVTSAPSVPTKIPDTTRVLPETTTQYLSGISSDGTVFTFTQSTSSLSAMVPGDVMVSDATANAPYGFLRKVTSLSLVGGQVVVETEGATLEEAIETGEAHLNQVLAPSQISSGALLKDVTLATAPEIQGGSSFFYTLDNVVLYDADGNSATTNDQIRANGSIRLEPSFDFSLVVRDFQLEKLSFTVTADETAELEIEANVESPIVGVEWVIAEHEFRELPPVMIGPLPVKIIPVLTVSVGVDGSVHVGVNTGVTQQATLRAGVEYANDSWSPVNDHSNQFYYNPPTLSASLDLKGYAGAQLSLLLYGVTGPYAKVNGYLELEANVGQTPWWILYGGLEVPVGVNVEILSRLIVGYKMTAIDYRLTLAQAQANTPPNLPSSPLPADGVLAWDLNADLSWTDGDPDGDSVTYDVYFEAGDCTPDALVSNDQSGTTYNPGTLTSNTDYYWRIVAKDEHGATTAGPVWEFTTIGGATWSFPAPPGTQPNGLAWDGSHLWMSSYMLNPGIYKLDPSNGSVVSVCTPPVAQYEGYGGLTFDGTYLWQADSYGGGIYKLSTSDCSVISTIPSPGRHLSDLAWDGQYLWTCGYPSQKIYKIEPSDGSVVAEFSVPQGTGQAQTAGLTYDGSSLWLSGGREIFEINPIDGQVISSMQTAISRPDSLAWDGESLWIASFDETMIYRIDFGMLVPSLILEYAFQDSP